MKRRASRPVKPPRVPWPRDLGPEARRVAGILSILTRESALTGAEIAGRLGLHVRQVGAAVRALRLRGVPVMSSSSEPKGYWIASSAAEVRALCKGFDRRARSLYKARRVLLNSAWLSRADGQRPLRRKA